MFEWDGNDSDAGNYGRLIATSNHLLFVADDGTHGHELHQYLRSSIRNQWMVGIDDDRCNTNRIRQVRTLGAIVPWA